MQNAETPYFDMMRFHSHCLEATAPLQLNPTLTSISNMETQPSLSPFYPNPAYHVIQLTNPDKVEAFQICNSLGQVYYFSDYSAANQHIDCSSWPRGLYLVRTKNGIDTQSHLLFLTD